MMGERVILAEKMTTEALVGYDQMMVQVSLRINELSSLAMAVWSDVLKELDKRGKVTLISGSYDDLGQSIIHRN